MLHYNYVYFDDGSVIKGKKDTSNYFYICTKDLQKVKDVHVVSYPIDYLNGTIHKLFVLHHHPRLNRIICLPFKSIWYPFYFNKEAILKNDRPMCFIVSGHYITPNYIRYLRGKYPGCKIVGLHRDSFELWKKRCPLFSKADIDKLFDLQFSYDIGESLRLNMIHFDEFESKINCEISKDYPLCDVFFAGYAKNRLKRLLEIYDILSEEGVNCKYYIVNAEPKEEEKRPHIIYAKKAMTYCEMLYYTINSRVILEINQDGMDGYTSRFLEAVMYNKKLITNNSKVKNSKFYSESRILVIDDNKDIDISFIKDTSPINYGYTNEFSPIHLIKQIDNELISRYNLANKQIRV